MMLCLLLQKATPISSLSERFKNRKSFVLSFRLPDCEPCDQFEQFFEQALRNHPGAFDLYQVNCNEEKAGRLCEKYSVHMAPAAAMFNSQKLKRVPLFLDADKRSDIGIEEFITKNVFKPYQEVNCTELKEMLGAQLTDTQSAFIFQVFDTVSQKHQEIVEKYKDYFNFYFIHDYDEEEYNLIKDTELGERTKYDQFNLILRYQGQWIRYTGQNDQQQIIEWLDKLLKK